jgi:formate dehydrogenase alpha subunit
MIERNNTVTVTIDNKKYQTSRGLTILQVAKANNIYIPTLCFHKDLSPHGGCRMCIVEVEGIRNFPTACTTPVEDGMIIRTHTTQIHEVRKEIIQLFMSEHPSSCLICDEKEECYLYLQTIQKAGVTTGCRYCPNNQQCELQDVVEYLGAQEINYPIFYRNLRVEKEDPFYDRDYNLCILCGRCIRMCQEVRLANVLAFKHRGRETVLGPAYSRTHLDSGCEFCGACVSVCPTGTLSEKARKWDGKPDREINTTCSFCGVGCQMRLLVKKDRIIGSLPAEDPLVNKGQLCVKGRFCVTEFVNGHQRLKKPLLAVNGTKMEITWDKAIDTIAQVLLDCPPEKFYMRLSPNCFNEDMYIAQKFVRTVMQSNNIDSSARSFYGNGLNSYLKLFKFAAPLSQVREAPVILCVGLDTRYGRSVVGVELRRALQNGAKIITIHPKHHSLALTAEKWIQPTTGTEVQILQILTELTGEKPGKSPQLNMSESDSNLKNDLLNIAEMLKNAASSIILVGSEYIQHNQNKTILDLIYQVAVNIHAGVLPLPAQNNFLGSILMGIYPECLPGGVSSSDLAEIKKLEEIWDCKLTHFIEKPMTRKHHSKPIPTVLYLIGEMASSNDNNSTSYTIYQNIYPSPDNLKSTVNLPAVAFSEADGTYINGEGRIQKVNKAVNRQGDSLPDWQILCKIAKRMGAKGFDFTNISQIQQEISKIGLTFKDFVKFSRKPKIFESGFEFNPSENKKTDTKVVNKKYPFLLYALKNEHTYRGITLSEWVHGAKTIFPSGRLLIHPKDATRFQIKDGDEVILTSEQFEKIWPVKISPEMSVGKLQVTLSSGEYIGQNPISVKVRKKNV